MGHDILSDFAPRMGAMARTATRGTTINVTPELFGVGRPVDAIAAAPCAPRERGRNGSYGVALRRLPRPCVDAPFPTEIDAPVRYIDFSHVKSGENSGAET